MEYLTAVILGIVEGLTEFLPISSTGHLIIAGHLLSFNGDAAETFAVVIQLGAILSVIVLYRDRFLGFIKPDPGRKFSGWYGISMLVLTTLPAVVIGFTVHEYIKEHLFTPVSVAWALAVGALGILGIESLKRTSRFSNLDQITPMLALGIGFFQCFAMWPGFSRSAATILGGMILGANRKMAAEYSFIAAVPVMIGATSFDLFTSWNALDTSDFVMIAIGFVVSFVSAMAAIKIFIRLLGRTTLRPFAYYRLLVAVLVLLVWAG